MVAACGQADRDVQPRNPELRTNPAELLEPDTSESAEPIILSWGEAKKGVGMLTYDMGERGPIQIRNGCLTIGDATVFFSRALDPKWLMNEQALSYGSKHVSLGGKVYSAAVGFEAPDGKTSDGFPDGEYAPDIDNFLASWKLDPVPGECETDVYVMIE